MHVEASTTYTMLMSTRGAHAGSDSDDETARQASATATAKAGEPANNAVSGTTGSRLSAEMDGTLIGQQEAGASNSDADDYDGPLSIGERHRLENIARNPEYAANQAKEVGIFGELVFGFNAGPNASEAETTEAWLKSLGKSKTNMAQMEKVQGQRTAYYESLTGQGLAPAEIFAKLLEFNANLPESHHDTLGWSEAGRPQSYSDYNKARFDYLQNLLDQGDGANTAEMVRTLIGQQETGTSNTDTDDYDGPLSLAVRHGLEDIANDPEYAATQARSIGVFGELVWAGKVLPTENNGFTAAERKAFLSRQNSQMAGMEQVQGQRTAYYENLAEQGLPPAEIFAKMLEFNANLPDSHDDTLGWSEAGRPQSYSDYNKARFDYLQNLLGQGDTKHSNSA